MNRVVGYVARPKGASDECDRVSSFLTLLPDVLQSSRQSALRMRKPRSQLRRRMLSPLKSSAKTFKKIPTANGPAAPILGLGKWTLAATASTSVRSILVVRILLLF
jgi:hypothetical protein